MPGNKNRTVHPPSENWPWRGMPASSAYFALSTPSCWDWAHFIWLSFNRLVLPARPTLALATAAFVAFLPQFLFISGAVTNDNLIILLSTLMIWLLLRFFGNDLGKTSKLATSYAVWVSFGVGVARQDERRLNLLLLAVGVFLLHAFFTRRLAFDDWPTAALPC